MVVMVVVVEDENGQISGPLTGCAEDRESLVGCLIFEWEDQSSVGVFGASLEALFLPRFSFRIRRSIRSAIPQIFNLEA